LKIVESLEKKASPEDITKFEEEIGYELPEDYKKFLLEHNGGRPSPEGFSFEYRDSKKSSSLLDFFYGIQGETEEHYDLATNNQDFKGRIPSDMLVIACDQAGNQICLGLFGNVKGKIYFWDHEEEAVSEGDPPVYGNLYFIANSFSEFVNGLSDL
jgi:cell wall assembly regulator SMI1